MSAGMHQRRHLWLLLALILLALALRAYRLDGQSLWADEGNSAVLAGRSFSTIAQDAALDIHPPLYYFILRFWTQIFGTSEIGLRSLSVLFGVALVVVVYLPGRRILGQAGGLWSALFAAVSPFQIYYSQEARMYVMLAFLSALTAYAAWRIMEIDAENKDAGSWWWPVGLYLLSAAAGLYTHYFFPILLLALNVTYFIAWCTRRGRRGEWRTLGRWGILQIAVLALYLPWLSIGMSRLLNWPTGTSATGALMWLGRAWRTLCLGPPAVNWTLGALAFLAVLLAGLWPWRELSRLGDRPARARYWLPALCFGMPIITMLALGLFNDSHLKFLLIASPFLSLLLARGIIGPVMWSQTRSDRRLHVGWVWGAVAAISLLVPTVAALDRYYFDQEASRDDYRGMVEYITAVARPDDAIALNAPGQWDVFSYYYEGPWPVYRLPAERPPDRVLLEAVLAQIIEEHDRLYILYWAENEADPDRIMETWLDEHTFKGTEGWNGNARLVVYETMAEWENQLEQVGVGMHIGESIQLESIASSRVPVAGGDVLPITFTWHAVSRPQERLKVFVQVLDAGNHIVGQRDAEPGGGASPTTSWEPGQTIVDNHGVLIEPGTPPGQYRLIAGLYNPQTAQRAVVRETGQDYIDLSLITVQRPQVPMPLSALRPTFAVHHVAGPLKLVGYDRHELGKSRHVDAALAPGSILHVTLYWQAVEKPEGNWEYRLWLDDHQLFDWRQIGGAYSTGLWEAGEILRDQVDHFLPGDLPAGEYRLRIELRKPGDAEARSAISLGSVTIH